MVSRETPPLAAASFVGSTDHTFHTVFLGSALKNPREQLRAWATKGDHTKAAKAKKDFSQDRL